ncbi:hypothetical protein NE237_025057 [Protea cynaroides]|uniref:Uncharacterized protein n=1 Tax=Protea cynaroides TaxID=273540 RepID=A0A9Q0JZS7_9MAGN|nr:hypothetical protein NE237_025057 [Protea cynaroides]
MFLGVIGQVSAWFDRGKSGCLAFRIFQVADAVFKIPDKPWTVPWTAETILQVMLLWIASFWFVGSWIIPFLAHAAGFSKESDI